LGPVERGYRRKFSHELGTVALVWMASSVFVKPPPPTAVRKWRLSLVRITKPEVPRPIRENFSHDLILVSLVRIEFIVPPPPFTAVRKCPLNVWMAQPVVVPVVGIACGWAECADAMPARLNQQIITVAAMPTKRPSLDLIFILFFLFFFLYHFFQETLIKGFITQDENRRFQKRRKERTGFLSETKGALTTAVSSSSSLSSS
jgi:hypothetical protein